jgi:flagellar biosynthetic protein FliO
MTCAKREVMENIKSFRIVLIAVITGLFVAASAGSGQTKNGIGSFDIEKVRKAAGAAEALDVDTSSHAASATASSVRTSEGIGWLAARICFYLGLIAAAIFVVMWLIKRLGLAGGSKIGGGSMDVLEVLPIGQHRTILLVRVRDNVYVVAQTQHQITLLDKVEGERALDLISSSKGGSISQFKDVFNSFMTKIKKP